MNRHHSALALPVFNPLANSNESDRSSSSNTTVTANAFSISKRPDLSTVFAAAPDPPPYHAVNNGFGGAQVNALNECTESTLDLSRYRLDGGHGARARLDASCCVYNGNQSQSVSSQSMSSHLSPPQFVNEYGGGSVPAPV